ncbi:hypothetical protein [Wenxinia marina]|uniref:Uncharacterized protein n=1 Tax=Wenxinia marina DSM 24838 TaxID=1123501 RepID=A0A0D0Q620_9RHOB|nr:hypothetical protein [Wenxinia marina]KIQ69919.1 hypothetical protein Wenmar_01489 [Wenxinia marina DSM 24838]GGL62192.1 hypothetical protein GCM10011392_15920 [Wenxinia marina]
MKTFLLSLSLAGTLALPALAQDADAALATLQELANTGAEGDVPHVAITADGCMLTSSTTAVSSQLGAPMTATATVDARELFPAAFTPDPKEDRFNIWIPREDQAPIELTMILDNDDPTLRETFAAGLGADCSAAGPCSATQAAPRMPVVFYVAGEEAGMDRARAFSTALSDFAAACG